MKNRYLHLLIIALVLGGDFSFFTLATAPKAEAYPYYRGPVERGVDRRVTRRTARRTTRRVVRRNVWYGVPAASWVLFRWGGYGYYRAGPLYYYPYYYGGRTVYVQIEVDSHGNPLPPPSASEIDIDIDVH